MQVTGDPEKLSPARWVLLKRFRVAGALSFQSTSSVSATDITFLGSINENLRGKFEKTQSTCLLHLISDGDMSYLHRSGRRFYSRRTVTFGRKI